MQLALRTARTFWLKRTVEWWAVTLPEPPGPPLVSRFLPTREQTKTTHSPASHHRAKTPPRLAPTAYTTNINCNARLMNNNFHAAFFGLHSCLQDINSTNTQ